MLPLAVAGCLVQLAAGIAGVVLFSQVLSLTAKETMELYAVNIMDMLQSWWYPFNNMYDEYKAMVDLFIAFCVVRALSAVVGLAGGLTNRLQESNIRLRAYVSVSRIFQVLEVVMFLFFKVVWKVDWEIGAIKSRLVVELCIFCLELLYRECVVNCVVLPEARKRQLEQRAAELTAMANAAPPTLVDQGPAPKVLFSTPTPTPGYPYPPASSYSYGTGSMQAYPLSASGERVYATPHHLDPAPPYTQEAVYVNPNALPPYDGGYANPAVHTQDESSAPPPQWHP